MKQRNSLRFICPGRAEIASSDRIGGSFQARTINVSRHGIGLETDDPCLFDFSSIQMNLFPGWDSSSKVSLQGRIVWRKQQGDRCHIGVAIDEMNAQEKSDLLERSYYFWKILSRLRP
jgi:hypothetical protein